MSVYKKITNIAAESRFMESMKNKELIEEDANKLNWTAQDTAEMLSAFNSILGSKLIDNDSIYLSGFGQFEIKKKTERISVNPANGKRYLVPPKLVPVFKPGTTIKTKLKELSDNE